MTEELRDEAEVAEELDAALPEPVAARVARLMAAGLIAPAGNGKERSRRKFDKSRRDSRRKMAKRSRRRNR